MMGKFLLTVKSNSGNDCEGEKRTLISESCEEHSSDRWQDTLDCLMSVANSLVTTMFVLATLRQEDI